MVITSQPASAIQPTMGMIAIRPWPTILENHCGSWNGHAKPSPTLVIGRKCNALSRVCRYQGFAAYPVPGSRTLDTFQLQGQDGMNLDGPALRGRILGRPTFRLGAVLALQHEVAVEPRGLGVHGSVAGLAVTVMGGNAEGRRGRLARVAVLEDARGL